MPFRIHFDTKDMRQDRQDELVEWVRSLGLVPEHFRVCGVILQGKTSYELHLSELIRDEHGNSIVDHAINDVVSKPRVVDLGQQRTWPSWLEQQA